MGIKRVICPTRKSGKRICHNKHVFVRTKHVFCGDKSIPVATKRLSQQNYVYHYKTFVAIDKMIVTCVHSISLKVFFLPNRKIGLDSLHPVH